MAGLDVLPVGRLSLHECVAHSLRLDAQGQFLGDDRHGVGPELGRRDQSGQYHHRAQQ